MLGNGQQQLVGAYGGPSVDQIDAQTHSIRLEELIAHLTGQHACQVATAYVQAVMGEAITREARRSPVRIDGSVQVQLDGAELLGRAQHVGKLENLHREHSHDYAGAEVPAILHGWMGGDDAEG